MRRVLLDTNIYGKMIEAKEADLIEERISKSKDIIIYGNEVIRKELRNIPKKITAGGKRIRPFVLGLYNRLVKDNYPITDVMKKLANDYFKVYSTLAKTASKDKLWNDFLIVACATIHDMDIVVSEDNKTMLSDYAVKAYMVVNELRNYRTPNFISYKEFRRLFV